MTTGWTKFALLAGVLSIASLGLAQEKGGMRRLESVNWDPVKKELTWVVSDGAQAGAAGKYQPGKKTTYHINMDEATMTFNGETRRFSRQEATSVNSLMSLISTYAVESTIWWEKGMGEKVTGGEKVRLEDSGPPDRCALPTLASLSLPGK